MNLGVLGELPYRVQVPPSGGSLEIGNIAGVEHPRIVDLFGSPFGGIPRNWKHPSFGSVMDWLTDVPPSGGSLEIGNPEGGTPGGVRLLRSSKKVPPSGGSLEIGNT